MPDDPLPAKSPSVFNPDPGGGANPGSVPGTNVPSAVPVPSLFERPVLPLPPPRYETEPLPRSLRLPRANIEPTVPMTLNLGYPTYQYSPGGVGLLPNAIPETNRWQISFGEFQRYQDRGIETPYQEGRLRLFDPYKPSLLKGDAPIYGQDIFLSLTATDQFLLNFARVPVGSGVSAAQPGSTDFYGRGDFYKISNDLSFDIELFKGETAFKPIDWAIHLTPEFNVNYTEVRETGILVPDPRGPNYTGNGDRLPVAIAVGLPGGTIENPGNVSTFFNTPGSGLKNAPDDFAGTRYVRRSDQYVALQEAFLEVHLRDLSDNYDFLSVRAGNQLFNSDFRGFIFDDTNSGIRLFGDYDNNRLQYNLVYFNMREKDTNSGLNTFNARDQDVIVFNVFRQDFLNLFLPSDNAFSQGYTEQFNVVADLDHGGLHYNTNGFITRPAPVGQVVPHDVNAVYLGLTGDGHIGPINITDALYEVMGRDQFNGIAGHAVNINAQMAAIELSIDHDYVRPKISFLYASGDRNPHGGTASGFDSIMDNPTFIGNPFSFYANQGFALGNTSVLAKTPDSLLLDLRTDKAEGQANFVNPGTLIFGLGADVDITPKLKMEFNANYIRFVNTQTVEYLLMTNQADPRLGYDISLGFVYRPLLTNNIIINAGFGAFLPQEGYRQIYRELTVPVPGFTTDAAGNVPSVLYNGILAVTLTF